MHHTLLFHRIKPTGMKFIKFDASTYSKLNLIKEDWPIESSMMHLIPNEKPGFIVCIQDQCLQPVMTLNDLKEQLATLI